MSIFSTFGLLLLTGFKFKKRWNISLIKKIKKMQNSYLYRIFIMLGQPLFANNPTDNTTKNHPQLTPITPNPNITPTISNSAHQNDEQNNKKIQQIIRRSTVNGVCQLKPYQTNKNAFDAHDLDDGKSSTAKQTCELQTQEEAIRYKSKKMSIIFGLFISLCGFNFGYGLSACSVINTPQVMQIYGIPTSQSTTHSLLIGLMPVGGIFGAIFNQVFIKYASRKYSIIYMTIILWVGLALMLIENYITLFVGRFIEGFALALFLSIGPIYLKQITPKELRGTVMSIFGLGKAFGVVIAYVLQNIFLAAGWVNTSYIVLLTFNGYTAIIQVVIYLTLLPQSPLQLVDKKKIEEAKQEILKIYKQQFLEEVLAQYIQQSEKKAASEALRKEKEMAKDVASQTVQEVIFAKKKKKAFLMGVHILLLRQFIGANCVTTFASQIIAAFNPQISVYMGLMLNLIQFLGDLLSVLFLAYKFGRRPILTSGIILMTIFSFAIAVTLIYQVEDAIFLFMSIYMFLNGGAVLTVGYSYPSEILAPEVAFIPNTFGWLGLAIVTSVPPIIVGLMPENNAYPLFLFFGGYGIFASIILIIYMKQSKGLTYNQIIQSF